jgi:hypothetical protein
MGAEVICRVICRDQTGEGKALLETSEILFRGSFSLKIPFKDISKIEARGNKLHVGFPDGPAVFELGKEIAEKWFIKIRYPKSLMDKLGVKPESRVHVEGIGDPSFLADLGARQPITATRDCDIVFLGAETPAALKKLVALQKRIKSNGAIWIIYPKGQKTIAENGVRSASLAAGLVDVKIARVSDTHTGLKVVIPVAKRE